MSASHDHDKPVTPGSQPVYSWRDMHLGLYLGIGIFLVLATVLTVYLSYYDFGTRKANFIVAMLVATVKVGCVAAVFMHLKGEKWTIWKFLLFTMFFCAGLFLLTLLHSSDPIFGTSHSVH